MLQRSLDGQVAVVTGAGRGVGRAIARLFAAEGADLAICARTASQLDPVAEELRAGGARVVSRIVDITEWDQVEAFAAEVAAEFGSVDILINNAAAGADTDPISDSDPLAWAKTVTTNVIGPYFVSRAFIDQLAKGARVVNFGSGNGHKAVAGRSAYGVGKAGLSMLTKCMAVELWERGIEVNEFIPGPTATVMLPWATHLDDEEEIARQFGGLPSPENPSERAKAPAEAAEHVLWLATRPAGGPTGQLYSLMRRPV